MEVTTTATLMIDRLGPKGRSGRCRIRWLGTSGIRSISAIRHLSRVYGKAGVASRNELAAWFFEDMLAPPPNAAK